jgi:tripartite ATP-independent transporter DctM subunit
MGPPGPKTSWKEKVLALLSAWSAIVLFGLVMGGLYFGWFSANEAAGIGAFTALVIVLIQRKLTWQGFKDALMDTAKTSAMIFFIIVGAMMFTYFLSVTGVSAEFTDFLSGLPVSRYVIMAIMIFIYLILGAIMDELGMIFLTVPIFLPAIIALGFDPIWFGIIVVLVCQCGAINPPVAINVFIIKGIAPEIPMGTIYRGILPFSLTTIILIAFLIAFPEIVMYLPDTMR